MRLLLCFFLSVFVMSAQEKISEFSLEKLNNLEWKFTPQSTFSKNNKHYILGTSKYYLDTSDGQRSNYNDSFHLFCFDENYVFEKKIKIVLSKLYLTTFNTKVLDFNTDTNKLRLLLYKDDTYYVFDSVLNLEKATLENMQELYKIELKTPYKKDYIKIVSNGKNYCILQFNRKEKTIHLYELLENEVEATTFTLEKEIFKRLRRNFGLLQQIPKERVAELDLTPGFQIHYNNDFIYLILGDCVSEGWSVSALSTVGNCSSDYYFAELHVLKIDTKKNTLEANIIGEDLGKEVMTYTVIDDDLFYAFYKSSLFRIYKVNMHSFEKKTSLLAKELAETKGLKVFYNTYSKKSKNNKKKEVDFEKFAFKFNFKPSIAIKKSDSLYDITLGNVKYRAYNSFADWLGSFAVANFTAIASSQLSNNELMATMFYFNNEIPKIYETRFKTDFKGNIVAFPQQNITESKKIILNNLKYFLKKRMVSPIGDIENGKEIYVLYRDKRNWRNFDVVKFPN